MKQEKEPMSDEQIAKWRVPQPTIIEVMDAHATYFQDDDDRYGYRTCPRCGHPVTLCYPDCCDVGWHEDEEIDAKCVALSKVPDEDDTILAADCTQVYWPDEEQDTIRWFMLFYDLYCLDMSHAMHAHREDVNCNCEKYMEIWPETDLKMGYGDRVSQWDSQ
jgi:hypothetical protein